MVHKNQLYNTVPVLAGIAILLLPPGILFAQINAIELKNSLLEKDQISNLAGYKISFMIAMQHNGSDPNQGMVFMDCKATWTKEGCFAMKITYHYEHPPVYAPLGFGGYQPIDYYEGNLIVWRRLEKYIVFAPDRNDNFQKLRSFLVDPNGKIVHTSDNMSLHRFPIGHINNMYQFRQFRMATGRGFSKYLETITPVESLSSGLTKATSRSLYASGIPRGTWELTLDLNSDYLVRQATLTSERADNPVIETTSMGLISKDGIKFAKYGTYKSITGVELSVEVTDISKVDGPNKLYEAVLSRLDSPLPAGAEIYDLRGKKPVVTTVE